jgi:hypothetical protein
MQVVQKAARPTVRNAHVRFAEAQQQGLTLVHFMAERKHILWEMSGA